MTCVRHLPAPPRVPRLTGMVGRAAGAAMAAAVMAAATAAVRAAAMGTATAAAMGTATAAAMGTATAAATATAGAIPARRRSRPLPQQPCLRPPRRPHPHPRPQRRGPAVRTTEIRTTARPATMGMATATRIMGRTAGPAGRAPPRDRANARHTPRARLRPVRPPPQPRRPPPSWRRLRQQIPRYRPPQAQPPQAQPPPALHRPARSGAHAAPVARGARAPVRPRAARPASRDRAVRSAGAPPPPDGEA